MGNPSVIIGRENAGEAVDMAFLDEVAKEHPHIGMLFIDPESGQLTKGAQPITLQDVKDSFNESDIPLFVCFSKEDVGDDYDQPIVIANDGTPLCGVIVEGDLKDKPPTSSKPVEFHIISDYLLEKIIDVAADVGNDLDKLAERFNRTTTQRDVLANISPGDSGRCEVFFLFANGKTAHVSKGNSLRSFDWGWSSRGVGADPVATQSPAKSGGVLSRIGNKAKSAASPAATAAAAPAQNNPPLPSTIKLVLPSKGRCDTRANLLGWYKQYSGLPTENGLPEGWEAAVEKGWEYAIPVPLKEHWLTGKGEIEFAKQVKENRVILFDPAKHPRAQVPPKTGDKPATPSGDDSYAVMVTPQAERTTLITQVKAIKTLDDTSKLVLPASKLELALASKFPSATEELLLKGLDDLEGISEDGFFLLTQKSPRWASRLILQLVLDRTLLKKVKPAKQDRVAM